MSIEDGVLTNVGGVTSVAGLSTWGLGELSLTLAAAVLISTRRRQELRQTN